MTPHPAIPVASHPAWCDPIDCQAGEPFLDDQVHLSWDVPVALSLHDAWFDPDTDSWRRHDLWTELWQGVLEAEPRLMLHAQVNDRIGKGFHDVNLQLTVAEARRLYETIGRLLAQAGAIPEPVSAGG